MRWAAALLALAAVGVLLLGCTSTVVPPPAPADPATVYLLAEARHRGLVLPRGGDVWVEYGYGDWDWYALNRDRWYHAFDTVLWPTRGTLGRREIGAGGSAALARRYGSGAVLTPIRVERAAAGRLVADLDRLFEAGALREEMFNARYGLHFVPHPDGFWFLNNCSDAVARWLRALGCEVSGVFIRLDFRVADAPGGLGPSG